MEAFLFDIDGTLIDSNGVDTKLFIAAAQRVLGVTDIRSDWTTYRNVTDQGVLREIMQDYGIDPQETLFDATKQEFISLLETHIEEHGGFREIPGALRYLSRLIAGGSNYVAYATGAWRESALLKLRSAQFPTEGIRVSTSSDFEDRVSIMRGALSGAPADLKGVTYYGDGVWDRAAAEYLGWDFVPVGRALGGLEDYSVVDA